MAFTYNDTLPTAKDKVRMLIGDIGPTSFDVSDEAIAFFLDQNNNLIIASARDAVSAVMAHLARNSTTRTIGPLSISEGIRLLHYTTLLERLVLLAATSKDSIAVPYLGGWKRSAKVTMESNSDREPLDINKGMDDNVDQGDPNSWWARFGYFVQP